jgi:hypothetical protein
VFDVDIEKINAKKIEKYKSIEERLAEIKMEKTGPEMEHLNKVFFLLSGNKNYFDSRDIARML